MVTTHEITADKVRSLLRQVVDPEIPTVTIEDLGVLRSVEVDGRQVVVSITPTYSGCPAMDVIGDRIREVLAGAGFGEVRLVTVYSPAWSTSDITSRGMAALEAAGIAPPTETVLCPACGTGEVGVVAEFGSTACKALMVCSSCGEPFDHFKQI